MGVDSAPQADPQDTAPVLRAALWMIGAICSFSAMAVAGREAGLTLDTFEIMMYRSLVGLIIVVAVITAMRRWSEITTRNFGTQMLRNAVHFSGQNLWFYAVTVIPLAQVFALEFTSPLWVVLLSPLILGERLTAVRLISALVGFAGILIVARPGAVPLSPGLLAAAGAALFFALTNLFTKRLTRTETIACIMFYLTAAQLVLGLVFSGYDGDIALPDAAAAPWVIVIALAGLVAHFCITNALAIAPATVVVPIDFVRLPTIAVIGMLVYGEALDLWVFVGALVIFGANYLNIWTETHKKRRV
ncbi:MAG: DMT family transporter [Rhodobacteraceae bacterium]|nr:DMT family transporter [Paracoccaceae bacterium]